MAAFEYCHALPLGISTQINTYVRNLMYLFVDWFLKLFWTGFLLLATNEVLIKGIHCGFLPWYILWEWGSQGHLESSHDPPFLLIFPGLWKSCHFPSSIRVLKFYSMTLCPCWKGHLIISREFWCNRRVVLIYHFFEKRRLASDGALIEHCSGRRLLLEVPHLYTSEKWSDLSVPLSSVAETNAESSRLWRGLFLAIIADCRLRAALHTPRLCLASWGAGWGCSEDGEAMIAPIFLFPFILSAFCFPLRTKAERAE